MIDSNLSRPAISASTAATQTLPATKPQQATASQASDASDRLSSVARQLSEALQRANKRDATLNRDQLRDKANVALNEIHGPDYRKGNNHDDAALPDTQDPQRLARAKQATDSERGIAPNPFKDMKPELLAAVMYDDSGSFTLNERRAASSESYAQRQAWKNAVIAESMLEWKLTRQNTRIYGKMLDYYRDQPPIEQAQMPDDYEKFLVENITNILDNPEQWHDVSLYDVLKRWQAAPLTQTLFSIMADDAQSALTELPGLQAQAARKLPDA